MTVIESSEFPGIEDIGKSLDTDIIKHQLKKVTGENNWLLAEEGVDDEGCAVWHMARRRRVNNEPGR